MSLLVQLYKFSKLSNSTAIPDVNTGQVSHVVLKENTSLLNPILVLQTSSSTTNPTGWNYAYIEDWDRYYYITDWMYIGALWEAHLQVDPLASWRSEIGESTQYVTRSSFTYSVDVVDNAYPATVYQSINRTQVPGFNATVGSSGVYVVGVISNESGSIGATKYYMLTQDGMDEWLDELMTNTSWLGSDFGDITDDVVKTISNPFEYIVSCKWFPLEPSWLVESPRNIKMGWYELPYVRTGVLIKSSDIFNMSITIPNHPQIGRGDWLNRTPYTTRKLITSYFGEIVINPKDIALNTTLGLTVKVDYITGEAMLYLKSGGETFSEIPGQLGCPIQIAQFFTDLRVKAAGTLLDLGQSIGKGVLEFFGFDTSGVGNPLNMPDVQSVSTNGVNGSSIGANEPFILYSVFTHIAQEDNTHLGRPLCQTKTIKTIPGYIMVGNPQVNFSSTEYEKQSIISYMQRGFFYV